MLHLNIFQEVLKTFVKKSNLPDVATSLKHEKGLCGCCIGDGENYFHSWDTYWNAKSEQVTVESEAYMVGSFYSTWNTPIGDRYSGEGGFFPEYVHTLQVGPLNISDTLTGLF